MIVRLVAEVRAVVDVEPALATLLACGGGHGGRMVKVHLHALPREFTMFRTHSVEQNTAAQYRCVTLPSFMRNWYVDSNTTPSSTLKWLVHAEHSVSE